MSIPYLLGKNSITVMFNGETHTVRDDNINYNKLREAIRTKDWDSIPSLLTPAKSIETFGSGNIEVKNGEIYYKGNVLHNSVTERVLQMIKDGFDSNPLILFLDKLMNNPSKSAVTELYDWLERTSLPITEDGDFLAYKKVRDDYYSFFDNGKTSNKVGETLPELPRNMVDDNRNNTCSTGYHFCSLSYLSNYWGGRGRVVILKINPANVVSIPTDYNFAKGRATTYTVIGEHNSEYTEAFSSSVVGTHGETVSTNTPSSNEKATTPVNTSVLGVDFETVERATLVRNLVDSTINRLEGIGRSLEQARMDGFNDVWNQKSPSLNLFTGKNAREAVEYAKGYFEGYDRANGKMSSSVSPSDYMSKFDAEIDKLSEVPLPITTSYHGYDNGHADGYKDGVISIKANKGVDLSGAVKGGENYRIGYKGGYIEAYEDYYDV